MPQFTLADLQTRVYDRLENNTTFYTADELTRAINEWVRVLNFHTGFLQTTVNVTGASQIDRNFYDVPPGVLVPMAVAFGGRQLRRSSWRAIAMRDRNWLTRTSANTGPVNNWMPMALRKFAIFPADHTGGSALAVTGVREPPLLAAASDVIIVPDEFVEGIEEGAAHTLMLKEGGKVFADASILYQKFLRKMKELGRYRRMKQPPYYVEIRQEKAS